jgi:acylphosphatase
MKKAKRFIVKGMVQGVGFRYFTLMHAKSIGVYGYVRNLYDGSVEVYAVGSIEQLANLKEKISHGPNYSQVESVSEEDTEIISVYKSFSIK